jgi:hypothetical protein
MEAKVFHFDSPKRILFEDATNEPFKEYIISYIVDFDYFLLPAISALANLISENKVNNFQFSREAVVYDGGEFIIDGTYSTKSEIEKYVNCAVFSFAFLKKFDCTLLDWESWPPAPKEKATFLENWFIDKGIPEKEKEYYYIFTKRPVNTSVFD